MWVLVVQKRIGGSIDASVTSATSQCVVIFGVWWVFRPEALLIRVSAALNGRVCNSRRTHVGGDYPLIAASSGLVPMMFMTRVIL
jgi:hypothetical protein